MNQPYSWTETAGMEWQNRKAGVQRGEETSRRRTKPDGGKQQVPPSEISHSWDVSETLPVCLQRPVLPLPGNRLSQIPSPCGPGQNLKYVICCKLAEDLLIQ